MIGSAWAQKRRGGGRFFSRIGWPGGKEGALKLGAAKKSSFPTPFFRSPGEICQVASRPIYFETALLVVKMGRRGSRSYQTLLGKSSEISSEKMHRVKNSKGQKTKRSLFSKSFMHNFSEPVRVSTCFSLLYYSQAMSRRVASSAFYTFCSGGVVERRPRDFFPASSREI